LNEDEESIGLHLSVANNSIEKKSKKEQVILDGETYQAVLSWQQGMGDGWQWGIELPYLSHRGGGLDALIENWHDLLGLSNSDREDWHQNQLRYLYIDHGETQVDRHDNSSGIGDIQLIFSRALPWGREEQNTSWHLSMKLPTGDEESMLGSGAVDLAFWLSGSDRSLLGDGFVGGYGQVGILIMGQADILEERQRWGAGFGTLGVSWLAYNGLDLKCQIDAHTPIYQSQVDQLGGSAFMLTFGGSFYLEDNEGRIDLSIGENLTTDTVPDFIINMGYQVRFH
jgi:hypothetical protein